MSEETIPVTVRILDKEYKISCPEGEHDALIASAKHVDTSMKKIREGGKTLSNDRVAVMAAINIAHELVNAESEPQLDSNMSARIDALQQSVDDVLNIH